METPSRLFVEEEESFGSFEQEESFQPEAFASLKKKCRNLEEENKILSRTVEEKDRNVQDLEQLLGAVEEEKSHFQVIFCLFYFNFT